MAAGQHWSLAEKESARMPWRLGLAFRLIAQPATPAAVVGEKSGLRKEIPVAWKRASFRLGEALCAGRYSDKLWVRRTGSGSSDS